MPYHLELKQFPRNSRAFNLSESELHPVLTAWVSGTPFTWGEHEWEPRKAKLTIVRGRELETQELGQGRGWPQAQRTGEDVTEALLGSVREAQLGGTAFRDEVLELLAVGDTRLAGLVALAAQRWPGRPLSERVATIERLVWELLQTGELELRAPPGGEAVAPEGWREQLLRWSAWGEGDAAVALRRRAR